MEFISAREFKEKSEEVQKVFLDWWKPSKGDIYCNLYNNQEDNVLVVNNCQLEMFKTFKTDIKTFGVPLLTEGQLRKFIEDLVCTLKNTKYFLEKCEFLELNTEKIQKYIDETTDDIKKKLDLLSIEINGKILKINEEDYNTHGMIKIKGE